MLKKARIQQDSAIQLYLMEHAVMRRETNKQGMKKEAFLAYQKFYKAFFSKKKKKFVQHSGTQSSVL